MKAQASFRDVLTTNSVMVNVCISHTWIDTIIPRPLGVLEPHPRTRIRLEATLVVTSARGPTASLLQPVFLEIPATEHPDAESRLDP